MALCLGMRNGIWKYPSCFATPATVLALGYCFDYVVDGLRHCFDSVVDGLRHCLIDTVVDELKHCFDSVVYRLRHCFGGG